jgi:ribosomal protein S21|tara:strand:+ start:133 stop:348 length:216 start_codon:yes stop_codon:yes gene_type:complete
VAINVIVVARPNEYPERLIRRFIKKVKREGVLEEYREKTSYYVKPSVKRKIKQKKARRQKERLERKLNKRK